MAYVLTEELKESVLQAAIQGKLSIKNCTDTPVKTTLKAIKELQTDLYKKKIEKPTKPTREVNDIEFFDIPEHWQWVELSQIGTMTRGSGIKKTEVTQTGFPCVRYGQLYTTFKDKFDKAVSFVPENIFRSCKKAHQGDVLMSLTGENNFDIALAVVYEGLEEIAIGGDMMKLSNHCMNPYYLSFVLNSEYGISWKRKMAKGNIIVHISNDKLANIMIPTPPVEEQARIVAKVNELMAKIDEYEKLENQLVQLKEQFPKDMRASLSLAAFKGELTVRQPNDSSVENLLETIQRIKEDKIVQGELKKEKPLPKMSEKDYPYQIPTTWKWSRFGDYCEKVTDQVASGSFKSLRENVKSLKHEDYALMVKIADFGNQFKTDLTYTDKHGYDFLKNSNLFGGELILSNIGSIGKVFIVPNFDKPMTLAPNSIMLRLVDDSLRDYVYHYLTSPVGYNQLISITSGTAMKKFNKTDFKKLVIPLPPIEEQQRIVDKLDEMLPLVDALAQMD